MESTQRYLEKQYGIGLGFGMGCNIDAAREEIQSGIGTEVLICGECGEDLKDCETKKVCYENRYHCDCDRIHRGDEAVCSECGGWNSIRGFHADKPLCSYCAGEILN